MQVWNVLQAPGWKYKTQKVAKNLPSAHHRTTFSLIVYWSISSELRLLSWCWATSTRRASLAQYVESYPGVVCLIGVDCGMSLTATEPAATARHAVSGLFLSTNSLTWTIAGLLRTDAGESLTWLNSKWRTLKCRIRHLPTNGFPLYD